MIQEPGSKLPFGSHVTGLLYKEQLLAPQVKASWRVTDTNNINVLSMKAYRITQDASSPLFPTAKQKTQH